MNKLFKYSLVGLISLSSILLAESIINIQDTNIYPLNMDQVSKSRGGSLPDKEAIEDGIGTLILGDINLNRKQYSNKTYNKILSNNKKDLVVDKTNPTNNINLEDLITNNIVTLDNNTLNNINNDNVLVDNNSNKVNGTTCDDGKSNTVGETWLNNICQGGNQIGSICNDNNATTINDVWQSNGTCLGEVLSKIIVTNTNAIQNSGATYADVFLPRANLTMPAVSLKTSIYHKISNNAYIIIKTGNTTIKIFDDLYIDTIGYHKDMWYGHKVEINNVDYTGKYLLAKSLLLNDFYIVYTWNELNVGLYTKSGQWTVTLYGFSL